MAVFHMDGIVGKIHFLYLIPVNNTGAVAAVETVIKLLFHFLQLRSKLNPPVFRLKDDPVNIGGGFKIQNLILF